jgi:site-specific DNA-methyltransferase (adenine-specific)
MKRIPMTSLCQTWKTPKHTYEQLDAEFHFDHDPCPPDFSVDGLKSEWGRCSFVNPPFKTIALWVAKAYGEWQKGKSVVLLIPSRTDTRWWHDYCMKASEIRFIKGRLKYEGSRFNAPFPSCVIIFRTGGQNE